MRLDEYMSRDAPGLAELIGKGEVNPTELLALERERAEQVNPLINAIIGPVEEADARSAARWRSRGTRWLPLRSVVTVDGDPVRRWYPSRRLGTPFGAGLAAVAPAARRASRVVAWQAHRLRGGHCGGLHEARETPRYRTSSRSPP
jgi:hypothetical protein